MTQLVVVRLVAMWLAATVAAVAVLPASDSRAVEVGLGTSLVGSNSGVLLADAAPGQTITQRMRVSNGSARANDIRLYAGAVWPENGVLVDDAAGGSNALSEWITLEQDQVRISPGQSAVVDFVVRVPEDAPDAEHHAVVWAETGSARSGVRVRLTVTGNNGPAPSFTVDGVRPARLASGEMALEVLTTAVGPRASSMSGALRLVDGPGNRWVPDKPVPRVEVAPGTSTVIRIPMGDGIGLPAGPWTARGVVHNGYARVRIDETVVFPDVPAPDPGGSAAGSLGSLTGSSASLAGL
ncbi:hypothetical protein [Dietzia sp. Alg238-R159]|uniref:hypothetical protein n=1 Tax=Dietzia sp. Alg238-R159 TaxID=2305986 RepID=UPI0013D0CAED|nr:hypothetical protein [Dietzia sp. Alg238-R159]